MISRPFHHSLENSENRHRLTRSMLVGVTGLLLVMTSILIWALYQDYQQTLQRAEERLQTQLRAYGSAVGIALMSADYALRDANQEVRRSESWRNDPAWLRSQLLRFLLEAPALDSMVLYQRDGSTVVSAGLAGSLRSAAPAWVRDMMQVGQHNTLGSSEQRIAVAMPVTGLNGEVRGALVATIDRDRVQSELESGEAYGGQQLLLLNSENHPLVVEDAEHQSEIDAILQRLIPQLESGQFGAHGTRLMFDDQYLFALRQLSLHPIRALAIVDRSQAIAAWAFRAQVAAISLLLVLLITLIFLNQWRKSAARERRTANDLSHLYQAIEQVPSAIVITDLQGRIIYVNKAYLERSGYQRHQVMGQKPNILSSGSTPPDTYRLLWQRLRHEQAWEGEFRNRMRNGRERIEQAVITPVRDVDGRVSSYFAIASDISEKREAEQRLSHYQVIVDASSEMLTLIDLNFHYLQVNNSYLEYHAVTREQVEGHSIADLWGEEIFDTRIRPLIERVFAGQLVKHEEWLDFPAKGRRYCKISCRPVHATSGKIEMVVVSISDMTGLKRSEEALRATEQRFRVLAEFAPIGIFEADGNGHNLYSNRCFCEMVGRSAQALLGEGWVDVIHRDDRASVARGWYETAQLQQEQWHCKARLIDADGQIRWFNSLARRYKGPQREETRYIGFLIDITEEIEHQQLLELKNRELEHLSTTDLLTGLPNRAHIEQLLDREIHRYERYGTGFGLIMLDVDHFKQVNDRYGHDVGDRVLQRIAALIADHTRVSDCAARWGGEEFLILCPNTSLEGVQQLAEGLCKRIEQTDFPVVGQRTCSFGVTAIYPDDQAQTLLKRADDAMYQAKKGGRNQVVVAAEPNLLAKEKRV